jgi:hypothetical protein
VSRKLHDKKFHGIFLPGASGTKNTLNRQRKQNVFNKNTTGSYTTENSGRTSVVKQRKATLGNISTVIKNNYIYSKFVLLPAEF